MMEVVQDHNWDTLRNPLIYNIITTIIPNYLCACKYLICE